jgi:peptidylprolyl isomerase
VKNFWSLAVTAGLIVALSGCSSDAIEPDVLADGFVCQSSGAEIESIAITGAFGEVPSVDFSGPLEVSETQRLVLSEGTGEIAENGNTVVIDYALYSAESGELIDESGFSEASSFGFPINVAAPNFPGMAKTLACTTVGSRVAGLLPASEAFGLDGAPQFGVSPGASVLFVFDIISIRPPPLDRLEGQPREPGEGFPAVSYAADGTPTMSFDEEVEVSTDFALDTVITGTGEVVRAGETVVFDYLGVNWNTGQEFDSSWRRGSPIALSTLEMIQGFQNGLVGQTVGSRVIIIIPTELGYGVLPQQPDGIGPDDTLVFVVDILGLQ